MGKRFIVYHSYYGCETGCCGHTVEMLSNGEERGDGEQRFDFDHPCGEDPKGFAREMIEDAFGAEHCSDLDWENCEVIND